MGNIVLYNIKLIEECLKVILVYYGVLNFNITKKKSRIIISILVVMLQLLLGSLFYTDNSTIIPIVFNGISACILLTGKIRTKILSYILVFMGLDFVDLSIMTILGWMFRFNPLEIQKSNDILKMILLYMPSLIVLIVIAYINKDKDKIGLKNNHISKRYYVLIAIGLICAELFMGVVSYLAFDGNIEKVYVLKDVIVLFSIISVCVIILLIKYVQNLAKVKHMQEELLNMSKKQNMLQKEYYKNLYDKSENLRKVRHDFKHHIGYLVEVLKKDKVDEAQNYLYQVLGAIESANINLNYSGNHVIDSVISGIMGNEENNDIKFTYEGKVPNKLNIEEVDICALIANVLENAVEACKKCNKDKVIDMKISQYKTDFNIVISNTYVDYNVDSEGNIVTQKEDKEYHGYGLKSIRDIVKKYKGDIEIITKNEKFIVEITLNL